MKDPNLFVSLPFINSLTFHSSELQKRIEGEESIRGELFFISFFPRKKESSERKRKEGETKIPLSRLFLSCPHVQLLT